MKSYWEKYKRQLIVAGIALGVTIAAFWFISGEETEDIIKEKKAITSESSETKEEVSKASKTIVVDIKGQVNKPGVYQLAKDARVQDLVHLAGGTTKAANVKQLNLAAKLKDEESIYVAKNGEESTEKGAANEREDSEGVNINTSSLQELQAIPGVGPAKAAAIIEYREANGLFQKVTDLKNIAGFGEKTIERLKNYITVD